MKSYLAFTPSGQLLEVVGDESRQMYAPPVSYAANDTAPDLGIRHALWHAKSRGASSAVIRQLQKEAKKAHDDQQKERQRQQTGGDDTPQEPGATTPFSRHSEEVPAVKKAATWEDHLKQLDAKLAKRALAAIRTAPAAHAQNICCEGAYKCPRCKAKAAAA